MMRALAFIALVAGAAAIGVYQTEIPTPVAKASAERAAFSAWAATHNKEYAGSNMLGASMEMEHRFSVYKDNVAFVKGLVANGMNGTWTASTEGPFMDLTAAEFKALLVGHEHVAAPTAEFSHASVVAADKVDWSTKGAVTPIKNQGQCGSCWSFSTTGSVEGINFISTGSLVSASEQQLVSCDHNGDQGCNGGLMDNAFQYIINNGGLDTESDYPYVSGTGSAPTCDDSKAGAKTITIDGFEDVPKGDEASLRQAITAQPVSVAVDATQWQYYGGGIFDGTFGYCGTQLDHGVLAVGFDMSDGKSGTYKVKNSWGPTWGESGYIRLPVNRGKLGMCGIAASASYPTKK